MTDTVRTAPPTPLPGADAAPGAALHRLDRQGRGLAHDVVQALGLQLRSGAIRPGDRLPTESALMQSFGVSRGVVREALSRLAAAGLVQTQHGVGSFALEPHVDGRLRLQGAAVVDFSDMLALLELRTSIEADAAGLAATRRSESQLLTMRQALADFSANVSAVGETVSPDFRFHLAIAQATGNRYYADLTNQLGLAVIPGTRVASTRLGAEHRERHLQKVNQEHHDIYAGIARGDAEAARAAMRIHLVNSRERQRQAQLQGPVPTI